MSLFYCVFVGCRKKLKVYNNEVTIYLTKIENKKWRINKKKKRETFLCEKFRTLVMIIIQRHCVLCIASKRFVSVTSSVDRS